MRRRLAAGNWKMNGITADLVEASAIGAAAQDAACEVVLCLPATLVPQATARNLNKALQLGGQDCHAELNGAFTGDISADMLADAGAACVIIGHSERRQFYGEIDVQVAAKAKAAWNAGLTAIICVGETEAQYRSGQTLDVLAAQIAISVPTDATPNNTVIAYEPIWAIGTGLTPTLKKISAVHAHLRDQLPDADIAILYGGSVSPGNAPDIMALGDVDGCLVGGASLTAEKFAPIITALETAK
ncbi:triose-phosphate isomerase [Pseudosulfitobacter pseudonitzschiae]|uniref:triose-phosphate isomerase n=1 Tax=Pseudosulfitobacter pseudonitzschiae TaxID=1402135 RepID=UPI003B8038F7